MPATHRLIGPSFVLATAAFVAACFGAEYIPISNPNEGDGGSTSSSSSSSGSSSGIVGNEDGGGSVDAGSSGSTSGGGSQDAGSRKRVFITTDTTTGKLPGLKGGDDLCKAAATKMEVGGLWVAFLSIPGANAIDRLLSDGPWYSMNRQTLLFTGKRTGAYPISGLGPAAPINQNELGQTFTSDTQYWTGTKQGGVVSDAHCALWTDDTTVPFSSGTVGSSTKTDLNWVGAPTPYTC